MRQRTAWQWLILSLVVWVLFPQEEGASQEDRTLKGLSTEMEDIRRQWNQELQDIRGLWNQESSSMQEEYRRQAAIIWEHYRREVDQIWDEFRRTTAKVWADYSNDTAARSVVDFEHGTIEVEVVVPSAEPNAHQKAVDRLKEQFLQTFEKEVSPGHPVLEGQLRTQTGQVVTPQNVQRFADTEVKGSARVVKRFESQDGVERLKVTARIPMVHEHAHYRASTYAPLAMRYGRTGQVPAARVLAIMHTESAFNPFARSPEGAIGLMQLIPHAAARDAYQALYGKSKVVSVEYLFNPENNVNLGTVYVKLLRDQYLRDVQDPIAQDYLVICAYNWGIGNTKRLVSQPNHLSRERVAAILRTATPQETRDYLERVLSRTTLYEAMVAAR